MKFVLAAHGTRGDVEPCATVGRELLRRGHEVRMAVPPNLVGFVESAGLAGVAYGPDSQEQISDVADFLHPDVKTQNPISLWRAGRDLFIDGWAEMGRTLATLADGADLLVTGQTYHGVVANVAEYYDIPLVGVHHVPMRVNGQLSLPFLTAPTPVVRSAMRAVWWLYGQVTKEVEDVQRRELRLPRTSTYATQRILQGGWLEIQAYDEVCFPGLAAEWKGRRPFVGALTMQLPTEADDEVASWIAAGKPPIYFGFGSTPVQTPDETVAMIAAACAELGERALIYSGGSGDRLSDSDHVKLVGLVNYATMLPTCRAAVHHGGAGTTAAGLRAGIPMLILWDVADQPLWAAQVKRLKVGSARRFSRITRKSLLAELRTILEPQYAARAREIGPRMTKPTASITSAADLLEGAARQKPVCFSASTRCVSTLPSN
jgi:UDP:flavonoid glycosyltransferase YjiC (YdhE family)